MPNRAILADIHDLKLDPTKPHTTEANSGRLGLRVTKKLQKQKNPSKHKVHHEPVAVEVKVEEPTAVVEEPKTPEAHVESTAEHVTEEHKTEKKKGKKSKDAVTE